MVIILNSTIFLSLIFFNSLGKGGTGPKFVIIDDGWQSVSMDPAGIASLADNSAK
jgi:hypothetical protein